MVKQKTSLRESCQIPSYMDELQLGDKKRALSLSLECPTCKKKYRIAASSYRKWKSARIRCRECGNSFPMAFSATEPPEPPQRPREFTVVRGTPVTAFRPDPPTPVSPVSPPEHLQGTPEDSSGIYLPPPPSGAGDDTSSVPHTEAPPILPLFEMDRLIGMLIKSVPHTEAPPISRPFETIKMEHMDTSSHSWDRNSAYWHILTGAGIGVACFLAAAGLFWAVAIQFIHK